MNWERMNVVSVVLGLASRDKIAGDGVVGLIRKQGRSLAIAFVHIASNDIATCVIIFLGTNSISMRFIRAI
jgi:hypothetical protein